VKNWSKPYFSIDHAIFLEVLHALSRNPV